VNLMGRKAELAALAAALTTTAAMAAAPADAAAVRVHGTIHGGTDGTCSYVPGEPTLHWHCDDATETYSGDLTSTAPASFNVDGAFNLASGATTVSGTETFVGCVANACGTLEWTWHASYSADPVTAEVRRGRGQAHITTGTGELTGADGSFRFACGANGTCTYDGLLRR
jgi:hypothetical protein